MLDKYDAIRPPPEPLDLERGLPTTREDVTALRRLRARAPVATPDFLASCPR